MFIAARYTFFFNQEYFFPFGIVQNICLIVKVWKYEQDPCINLEGHNKRLHTVIHQDVQGKQWLISHVNDVCK